MTLHSGIVNCTAPFATSTDMSNSRPSMGPPTDDPPPQSCARKTRRCTLVTINVLVLLIGLFFLGVGIAAKTQFNSAMNFNTTLISAKSAENFKSFTEVAPTALIVFGSFIVVFCLTGIVGGCCEYRPMLFIYVIFLTLVVLCQLGVGGYVISERRNVGKISNDIVSSNWDNTASRALFQTACEQTLLATKAANATCNVDNGASVETCQNCISGVLADNLAYLGAFILGLVVIEILALVLACFGLRKPEPPPSVARDLQEFKAKLGQLDTVRVV